MDIENCDEMIKACEVGMAVIRELDEYRKIGTLDECRTAKEKQTPKMVTHEAAIHRCSTCPTCKNVIDEFTTFNGEKVRVIYKYCHFCGQALKWGD